MDFEYFQNNKGSYRVNKSLMQRNIDICKEFRRLKADGVKNSIAFQYLAGKYYLSEGTINSIIYAKK